jgi:hypothetical protein
MIADLHARQMTLFAGRFFFAEIFFACASLTASYAECPTNCVCYINGPRRIAPFRYTINARTQGTPYEI